MVKGAFGITAEASVRLAYDAMVVVGFSGEHLDAALFIARRYATGGGLATLARECTKPPEIMDEEQYRYFICEAMRQIFGSHWAGQLAEYQSDHTKAMPQGHKEAAHSYVENARAADTPFITFLAMLDGDKVKNWVESSQKACVEGLADEDTATRIFATIFKRIYPDDGAFGTAGAWQIISSSAAAIDKGKAQMQRAHRKAALTKRAGTAHSESEEENGSNRKAERGASTAFARPPKQDSTSDTALQNERAKWERERDEFEDKIRKLENAGKGEANAQGVCYHCGKAGYHTAKDCEGPCHECNGRVHDHTRSCTNDPRSNFFKPHYSSPGKGKGGKGYQGRNNRSKGYNDGYQRRAAGYHEWRDGNAEDAEPVGSHGRRSTRDFHNNDERKHEGDRTHKRKHYSSSSDSETTPVRKGKKSSQHGKERSESSERGRDRKKDKEREREKPSEEEGERAKRKERERKQRHAEESDSRTNHSDRAAKNGRAGN
jgi:hypothetical protein